jgi:lysophospholipid acyltransferase (LPLAT)-like uncharacterized protein
VTPEDNRLFQFATLDQYKWTKRLLIRVADLFFYLCIGLIGLTIRFTVVGMERHEAIFAAGRLPIYNFWHDRIFLHTYFWRRRKIVVMTSQSFDGEYIARFIQRFGFGAIRGSSSKGGAKALVEMIKTMRRGHTMACTIDGPRGPRYEVKPGPVLLAKKTGNPILPVGIEPKRYFTVNSWDKMQVPMPFTRALVMVGEPIFVSANADDAEIERKVAEFQSALDEITERGLKWRTAES